MHLRADAVIIERRFAEQTLKIGGRARRVAAFLRDAAKPEEREQMKRAARVFGFELPQQGRRVVEITRRAAPVQEQRRTEHRRFAPVVFALKFAQSGVKFHRVRRVGGIFIIPRQMIQRIVCQVAVRELVNQARQIRDELLRITAFALAIPDNRAF